MSVLLLLGCGVAGSPPSDPAPAAPPPTPIAAQEMIMEDQPFLEAIHQTPGPRYSGLRIFPDGRYETCFGKGGAQTGDLAADCGPWQLIATIAPDRVQELQGALRQSGFFQLPPTIQSDREVMDGGLWTWVARLDGQDHRVELKGTPTTRSPVIDQLARDVQIIPFRP